MELPAPAVPTDLLGPCVGSVGKSESGFHFLHREQVLPTTARLVSTATNISFA
jgi:hypothetical protein